MIFKDRIYRFELFYCDYERDFKEKVIYSNTGEIYELEDVPQTLYLIRCTCIDLTNEGESVVRLDDYEVGDEITEKDAEEEIEKLESMKKSNKEIEKNELLIDYALKILKNFLKNKKENVVNEEDGKIYINKNIRYKEKVEGRIKVIFPSDNKTKIISPRQIANGRIYPPAQTKNTINDDNYIDLE